MKWVPKWKQIKSNIMHKWVYFLSSVFQECFRAPRSWTPAFTQLNSDIVLWMKVCAGKQRRRPKKRSSYLFICRDTYCSETSINVHTYVHVWSAYLSFKHAFQQAPPWAGKKWNHQMQHVYLEHLLGSGPPMLTESGYLPRTELYLPGHSRGPAAQHPDTIAHTLTHTERCTQTSGL